MADSGYENRILVQDPSIELGFIRELPVEIYDVDLLSSSYRYDELPVPVVSVLGRGLVSRST